MPTSGTRAYPIHLVSRRMAHHASASGYDRLADHLDARVIHAPPVLSMVDRAIGKLGKPAIRRSGLTWYHRDALLTELAVARRWLLSKGRVFHFLYGENQFRYAGYLRRLHRGNIAVATYHTPQRRFREVVRDPEFIATLDAVIVVANVQKAFLAQYVPPERIFFVPHGIDIEFFAPAESEVDRPDGPFRCIAVGSHLRDHATLAATARLLADSNRDIRFDVVTRKDLFFHYSGLPNVDLHSAVADETLVSMYRRADLMVLPLLDATANNSLLEAMACGVPIVTTDLSGVRDYVDSACATLTAPRDAEGLARAVLALCTDEEKRRTMAAASRLKAETFAWHRVAERTLAVYDAAWAARG